MLVAGAVAEWIFEPEPSQQEFSFAPAARFSTSRFPC
jgi:hypothetical protein